MVPLAFKKQHLSGGPGNAEVTQQDSALRGLGPGPRHSHTVMHLFLLRLLSVSLLDGKFLEGRAILLLWTLLLQHLATRRGGGSVEHHIPSFQTAVLPSAHIRHPQPL